MNRLFLTISLLTIGLILHGQSAIGKFSAHIPLHSFHSVAAAGDYVYAATDNGLMLLQKSSINSEHPVTSTWTKVDGLSDVDINKIYYDTLTNTLIISYNNGNLDFIKDDRLFNINNIKERQINNSKVLSQMHCIDRLAYLVYPFGIVIVNIDELLIEDTWFTKAGSVTHRANDFAITDNAYVISTDDGIFHLDKDYINPANFGEWQLAPETEGQEFQQLCYFAGTLFAVRNRDLSSNEYDTLYALTDGVWSPSLYNYQDVRSLYTNQKEMAICDWNHVQVFNTNMEKVYDASWYPDEGYPSAREAVLDKDIIWAADHDLGLVYNNRTYYSHRYYTAAGPFSNNVLHICSQNGIVATVPGLYTPSTYAKGFVYPSISWYVNQNWSSNSNDFIHYTDSIIVSDLVNVKINPDNEDEWYVASWGGGLFKCNNHRPVAHYHSGNSPLESTPEGHTFVSGLDYDSKGNLWITNSQSDYMLKMLEPNGTWHQYNITRGVLVSSTVGVVAKDLLVDSRNYKWVTFPRGSSLNRYNLVVFNENGTYDNQGDDQFIAINMNATAEVTSTTVNCIAEDLDGEIWLGTDKGIKVIYYPQNVFKGTATPRNILLEQDGYVSVLFEWENVTAIAVDGANRKWIGTSKAGAFLMSEDGQKQLMHFTAEDHPLFSNQINHICIDDLSGEVFFATDKGLVSYRGDAIRGFEEYQDELFIYPNPVRSGYSGVVAIRGLKENSLCKITDSLGKLVWQGFSNGGQVVWNCTDYYGNRPATGVYYVMVSDENGKEHVAGKFLFIH
ncbi:MAG: T9SS type A sorting domain-containing protein [Bacteroidales bacterium]|nr:T9SS type A sorting domain-containing protein [Bacteroidales bacterium]